jgi:CTP-dependent riboflavin kinase
MWEASQLGQYKGFVKTGRGGAIVEMSNPDELEEWEILTGLKVIPGTLNLHLDKPFDLSLLNYISFSEIGWDFDPTSQGYDFKGDIGMYYHRIIIFFKYPGILAFWTWVPELSTHAELISSVHLRTELGLKDGDTVEFALNNDP